MLVLSRKIGDELDIENGRVVVRVLRIRGRRVWLGFEGDGSTILRREARKREPPHPMLCVQHGGSPKYEASNTKHGFKCPRCEHGKD